jgi:hypothetical protein
MSEIRYTLISDGSSDSTLLEVIKWLFNDIYPTLSANGGVCDFGRFPNPPRNGDVAQRVRTAMQISPYDICFYHRDAESIDVEASLSRRTSEIKDVLSEEVKNVVVCVIPVKMMESWLLIDREAIKKAASNRNYDGNLDLPRLNRLESHQTPKDTLHNLLRQATNNNKRRLKNFKVDRAVHLVAEYIEDYSPLRELEAFRVFEAEMRRVVDFHLSP